MENKYGKTSVFKNMSWKLLERSVSLMVTFAVTMVLSRLLEPSDFGLAALVTVFVTLSTYFVTSGLGSALIQKKEADELDFSSIFWLNLGVAVILYLIIFLFAPLIEGFFNYPHLGAMLRVLSLNVMIAAINSIQRAYIAKNMLFRYYFFSTLTGKIGSGLLGIGMAIAGYGVWALIGQTLSLILFETVILWFTVKWRPHRIFSWERTKRLYSYAWKVMLTSFIEAIREQLRNLFIGKRYSSQTLGYYDKGFLIPTTITTNISISLSTVMFPVLSNAQDDRSYALILCRRMTGIFAYCAFPLLTGMMVAARPMVSLLLSEKWLPSVPFLQIACLVYMTWIIETPIKETLKSLGYADICLKMQVIKTVFALVLLLSALNIGVMAIALSGLVSGFINVAVSMFYGNGFIKYEPHMLFLDLAQTLALNLVMFLIIYPISLLSLPGFLMIMAQIIAGITIYTALSKAFKNSNYSYVKELIKGMISKRNAAEKSTL